MNLNTLFKWRHFFALALVFILASCQKESSTNLENQLKEEQKLTIDAARQLISLSKERGIKVKFQAPEHVHHQHETAQSRDSDPKAALLKEIEQNIDYNKYRAVLERAINPDDFVCEPTIFDEIVNGFFAAFTLDEIFLLLDFGFDVPFLEALVFDNSFAGQSYGRNGEFTSSLTKGLIQLKNFWDIPTDILMVDMKGTVFKDIPLVAQILQDFYISFDENGNIIPLPADLAVEIAQILNVVFGSDTFQNFNHPLFSLNAFAFGGFEPLGIPRKIAMGDGIMDVYKNLGLGSVAETFILAHEYGHQIQFANNYFTGENTPEEGRRIELMADAYGAYAMAHGRGFFVQSNLIERFATTAGIIGDCAFSSPGHHGTPNQRAKAAMFGVELAKRRTLRDVPLTSQEFFELFQAELPNLIAPDAN